MIEAPLPHALSEKQAFTAVGCFRLCRLLFLRKATISDHLSPFPKKLIYLTALQMLPGFSGAHPSIMKYKRQAAHLSVKIPEQ